jgi:hypothetical protein
MGGQSGEHHPMSTKSLGYWASWPALALGLAAGLLAILAVKAELEIYLQVDSEMYPRIQYYLWPVLTVQALVIVSPLEAVLRCY